MRNYLFDYPRLKDFPKKEADSMLVRVFKDTELHTVKKYLDVWRQIAMISSTPAYHTDDERGVIKRFCADFSPLIDAMYCIAKALQTDAEGEDMSKYLHEYIINYYKPDELPENIIHPFDFPAFFFDQINIQCTRSLLWVLFEAVVIYNGELKANLRQDDLVITYERFLVIAEGAYSIKKKFKDRAKYKDQD